MAKNSYPGLCRKCRGYVEPGDGYVDKIDGAWSTVHHSCIVVVNLDDYRKSLREFDL